MAMAIRVAGNEEGKGKGGKVMAMVIRVTGKWTVTAIKRAMATVMRVAGKQRQRQGRWQWQRQ
jgi:hypothetical protein